MKNYLYFLMVVSCSLLSGMDLSLESQKSETFTLLAEALKIEDGEEFSRLFDPATHLHEHDETGGTLLHWAARFGNQRCVEILLQAGARSDRKDLKNLTPFDYALISGSQQTVQEFLNAGIAPEGDGHQCTPLHIAAVQGSVEKFHLFKKEGGKVETELAGGIDALHLATRTGHLPFVQALLATGRFDINKTALIDFSTPVHIAIAHGYPEILEEFIRYNRNLDPMETNDYYFFESPHAGNTVYHTAALSGQRACLEVLLEYNIPGITTLNYWSETPLLVAIINNKPECISRLIEAGGNTDRPLKQATVGFTLSYRDPITPPLHQAAVSNSFRCIAALVRAHISLEETDEMGDTALHRACKQQSADAVKELLAYGAHVNAYDRQGMTPLHTILSRKKVTPQLREIVLILLDGWANTNIPEPNEGLTPFHYAILNNNIEFLDILVSYAYLLDYEENFDALDEAQARLKTALLVVQRALLPVMQQYAEKPNMSALMSTILIQTPLREDIAHVFFHELRYGVISKSIFMLTAKDFVINLLVDSIQTRLTEIAQGCLAISAKRKRTWVVPAQPINQEMKDHIFLLTHNTDLVRSLIRSRIDAHGSESH